MSKSGSSINEKGYWRRNRLLLPKGKSQNLELLKSDVGINKRAFHRSPHLQAVMNRIEERRMSDQQREIFQEDSSQQRRNHRREDKKNQTMKGTEGDVLELFAKYDNMLEQLVQKNMELMNLAQMRAKEIPDDETVLTENALQDSIAIEQFQQQQLDDKTPNQYSKAATYDCNPSRRTKNPYLQFKNTIESKMRKQSSKVRTTCTPTNQRSVSSVSNDKRLSTVEEEIVDTFRPLRKTTPTTSRRTDERLKTNLAEKGRIQELRQRQRKLHGAQERNSKKFVYKSISDRFPGEGKRKNTIDARQCDNSNRIFIEEKRSDDGQIAKSNKWQSIAHWPEKQQKLKRRNSHHCQSKVEKLPKRIEDSWYMCPVDLPEPHLFAGRKSRKGDIEVDIGSQSEESDADSFGPPREARKLKKKTGKIYYQSRTLGNVQEDMRAEMLQLKTEYKQKKNKLKRDFLRSAGSSKWREDKALETDHSTNPEQKHAPELHLHGWLDNRDDSISYEVRDGVIVLDDILFCEKNTECELLGDGESDFEKEILGVNNYMRQPVIHTLDEMDGHVDQNFMQQPVMELAFPPHENIQYTAMEWPYNHQRVESLQSNSNDSYRGLEGEKRVDSVNYETKSVCNTEDYGQAAERVGMDP